MKIVIEGKFLKIIDKEILRTKNVNSYKMSVEYDSFYNDRVLMIYFKQDDIKKIVTVGPDNIIDIPHEVLENVRDIYIGFYSPSADGDKLKDRYCSNFDSLTVIEGAYDESATPTEELSTTILEKYLQEMKEFYNESLKEYNKNAELRLKEYNGNDDLKLSEYNNNAKLKTEEFNRDYELKKEEIDKVADEVAQNKTEIEEIEKRVKESEQNAKTSETNAKTSEENAQNSAENASKIETNIINIQEDINASKSYIDEQKESIDKSVENVEKLVDEATNQANISKAQAKISTANATQTTSDKTSVENTKNEVSIMKTSIEQTKSETEQIKNNTQKIYDSTFQAKNETLEAKEVVENSLENERIISDKKYARAIESDTITINNFGQVECDESGYMKEVSIESSLPEVTQETREGYNIIDLTPVIEVSTIAGLNFEQINSNTIKLSGNTTSTWQAIRLRKTKEIISGNSYTIYAKMNYNGKSTKSAIRFGLFNQKGANFYNTNIMTLNLIDTNKTSAFFNFTPEFDEEENEISYFRFVIEGLEKDSKYDFELSVMLLEGVYNESNMPDFELYGISPSFDHPSDFKNIIQNIKVFNTKNDNFFDIKNCEKVNGYYSASGVFANDNNNISFLKISLPKGDITISSNYNISKILGFKDEDYSTGTILSGTTNNFTFNNGEYKYFGFYTSIANYNQSDFYVMINRGEEALPYVPFNKGYAREIALPEGQFLGNLKGYSNAIDKGVLKGQLKELVLTGDESWKLFQTNTNTARFVLAKAPHIMVNSETETMYLCNYFKAYLPSERIEDKEGLFVANSWYNEINQNEIYIRTNINEISTLNSFKAKLKELYDSGTPVKILYVALKEEQQELSQENLQVVNSLQTYHGENNISTPEVKLTFKANQGIPSYVDKVVNEKLVENNLSEREISDNKYARALKTPVTDVESTRIYAENDVVDDLIINGVELTQVVTENSPSLDNPSEIQIASEQNIQICKNNYLNTTQIANENFSNGGLTVATDENGIFTVNGTHSEQVNINFTNLNFNIKENQVIKLIPLGGNVNYQGNIFNCINSILWNKEWKTLTFLNLNSSLITSSDTVKYFQVRFIIPVQQSSITYTNFKFGIMVINADDNIQDYHPYYGTNITIPLVNSAIGQYADTIDRENNVQNKVIQELTLTGDENWNAAGSNDVTNVFSINLNYSVENYTGLCNFLKTGVSGNVEKFTPLGTSLYIAVNKTRASTVEEFKALLAQLYSSGNPLKVYLVRVSPTKNPLSEEVQTALSNLKLYQDLNNIAIDGGSMNFIYNKSLLRSLEEKDEKIDGLQSQIDEIKSLLSSTSTASLLAENLAKDNESEVI